MNEVRWKVVATGPWEGLPGWQAPLEAAGCEVVLGRSFDSFPEQPYTEDELIELLRNADAAIVSTRDRITARLLANCPQLKVVAKTTIGIDNIDLVAATDAGVLVVNSPAPENYLGVAEATIGLVLALVKRLSANQRRLRENLWKDAANLGTLLAGQTVGILGLGRIGANVARRLSGWDVRLLTADPYVDSAVALAVGARMVSLDELVRESDVLTIHVALTRETRHMIGEEQLRTMKPSAYLVNTSRGSVVDETALASALQKDWIAGAALDVFESEPLPAGSPLRCLHPDRLILTPHSIGNNLSLRQTGTRMAVENVIHALQDKHPENLKNPTVTEIRKERHADTKKT